MRTGRLIIAAVVIGFISAAGGCQEQQRRSELTAGFASLDQHNFAEAMAAADRFVAKAPSGYGAAEGRYLRGRTLEQRPKRDDASAAADLNAARSDYEQALQLRPSRQLEGYLRTSLGNVCYWLNDFAAAEAHFARAYALLDDAALLPWVLYRRALCQQRLGNWAAADATFQRVRQEYPGTEAASRSAAHEGARAFYVQVSAFLNPALADRLVASLHKDGVPALRMYKTDRKLHVVLVGPIGNYVQAMAWKSRVAGQFKDALIIP